MKWYPWWIYHEVAEPAIRIKWYTWCRNHEVVEPAVWPSHSSETEFSFWSVSQCAVSTGLSEFSCWSSALGMLVFFLDLLKSNFPPGRDDRWPADEKKIFFLISGRACRYYNKAIVLFVRALQRIHMSFVRFRKPKTLYEEKLVEKAVPSSTKYKNKWPVSVFS